MGRFGAFAVGTDSDKKCRSPPSGNAGSGRAQWDLIVKGGKTLDLANHRTVAPSHAWRFTGNRVTAGEDDAEYTSVPHT